MDVRLGANKNAFIGLAWSWGWFEGKCKLPQRTVHSTFIHKTGANEMCRDRIDVEASLYISLRLSYMHTPNISLLFLSPFLGRRGEESVEGNVRELAVVPRNYFTHLYVD